MEVAINAPYDTRDLLGEAPHWDDRQGLLYRVDYLANAVHRLDLRTGVERTTTLPVPVSFAIPVPDGRIVVGLPDTIELLDPAHDASTVLAVVDQQSTDTRCNDGKVGPCGQVLFGTLSQSRSPVGACYRLGPSGRAEQVFNDVTLSNGLGWDVARDRFYYVDSWTWRIDVCDYDLDTATPTNRRTFATIDPDDGMPDGLCVDSEGGIWVALFGGGQVRRYTPDGALDEIVALPVSHPTSLSFGGPDLGTVCVTSSRHRLTDDQRRDQPLAGALLTFDAGVTGLRPFEPRLDHLVPANGHPALTSR